jgi:hypothetical protein
MKVGTENDNNFGYEKITILVDNIPLSAKERPRMQDFALFIPELLGVLSGPQTSASQPSPSICLLLFNFLLLLQNLLTSPIRDELSYMMFLIKLSFFFI